MNNIKRGVQDDGSSGDNREGFVDEYDMYRRWFFNRGNGINLLTLLVTTVGIGVLIWQNVLIMDSNKTTASTLEETQRQITNDSIRTAILDRPWIQIGRIIDSGINKRYSVTHIEFVNSGNSIAKNVRIKSCMHNGSAAYNFSLCNKGWKNSGPHEIPPKSSITLNYFGEWERSWLDKTPQTIAIYGTVTYDKQTDENEGHFEFCVFYYQLLQRFVDCRDMEAK